MLLVKWLTPPDIWVRKSGLVRDHTDVWTQNNPAKHAKHCIFFLVYIFLKKRQVSLQVKWDLKNKNDSKIAFCLKNL